MPFTSFDPARLEPAQRHKLSIGTIVPRPIAWTTSLDAQGQANLVEYTSARTQLTNAEQKRSIARYDYQVKLAELERATATYSFE